MAKTYTLQAQLKDASTGADGHIWGTKSAVTLTATTSDIDYGQVWTVGDSEESVDLTSVASDLTTAGQRYIMVKNKDATYNCLFGFTPEATASYDPPIELQPSDVAVFPLATTADILYAKCTTASQTTELEFFIFAR